MCGFSRIYIIQNSIQPLRGLSHSINYISEGSVSILIVLFVAYIEQFWLMTALPYAALLSINLW